MTIDEALGGFLADARERDAVGFEATELAIDNFVSFLEGYGYQYVEPAVSLRIEDEDPDEDLETPFIERHPARILPATVDEFLYWWQIRKSIGDVDDARANGHAVARLMAWLVEQELVDADEGREAEAIAIHAADEVARAKKLEELLRPLTSMAPLTRRSEPDEIVEDHQRIVRIEPGRLWFDDDIGPLAVAPEASDIAEVGWWVNVAMERHAGDWYLTELGGVYPKLEGEDGDDAVDFDW